MAPTSIHLSAKERQGDGSPHAPTLPLVREGLVEDVIIDAADAGNALIVLGAFCRTSFARALLGSKAERIINKAEGAVLVTCGYA